MNKYAKVLIGGIVYLIFFSSVQAEPIYHEKHYPNGSGPFPAVIALHTSGGFKTVKHLIQRYVDDGFAVYAPDFFKKHGLTPRKRMQTFDRFREDIEKDLSKIVALMKKDPKVQEKNVFATGFSNGGFWVSYLTGSSKVSAGVSHYGVWKANYGREITNPYPMKYFSKSSAPILALHGGGDSVQRIQFAEEAWDELRSRGARLKIHVYPDADHAWDRKNYKKHPYDEVAQNADKDSHKRTIEFFKKHIK
jgi:carboxymethylenebutenolidase